MKSNIKFNWRTNKASFPANSVSLAYVLLEAVPIVEKQNSRQPLNLALVLDRSGSMKGTKIENVRKAVNAIIEQLTEQDILSVVLFNEEVELLIPAQSVSNKAELKKKIDQITHGGGTMISKGFRIGLDELQSFRSEDRINRMILLTDGQTYGDEDQCCQLAQEAARQNIAVTALGVGDEWYEDMIDAIAQYSSGKSDYIAQPEDILSFFNEEVETFRDTVFQNATLTLRLSDGVVPKRVFRVTPMISNLGFAPISEHDIILNLKELTTNVGQRILVELMLPARPEGDFRLAQAELCFDIPQEGVLDEKIRMDLIFKFSENAESGRDFDADLMNIIEKVTAFNLQTRALDDAAAGNISGATQKLRAAATRLINLNEADLAQAALQEADNLEKEGQMSKAGTKKLRYETRKLTRRLDLEEAA